MLRNGENPNLMTMWTVLGWPIFSVAIPIWLDKKIDLPYLVKYDTSIDAAPLCNLALQLKERAFSYTWGYSSKYYVNINAIVNADQTGMLQVLQPFENQIFEKPHQLLKQWRSTGVKTTEMQNFYHWIDKEIPAFYKLNFQITY